MSNSTGECRPEPALALSGERLAELLSAIAEAPDFRSAAGFLLQEIAGAAGAQRALLLTVHDGPTPELIPVVSLAGAELEPAPTLAIPLDDMTQPVVLATLSLLPVSCDGASARRIGLPYAHWTALAYPQPHERGARGVLPVERARALADECTVRLVGTSRERALGHAPCGVIVLDGQIADDVVRRLDHVLMLAGPVLSRMAAVESSRKALERLDQQRELMTTIINALPDPIVITDAANDIIVENRRAEHLLSAQEFDSEGRRRAVEINNLLFTSFLAKAVMGGGHQAGARELNLVDPDEGNDLLFEVLAHPLPASTAREGSFLSVLRDVTDLRRAANELERQVQRGRLAEIEATKERDRLNLILENVADPILVTDEQSNIILMNEQAERLFDVAVGQLANRRLSQAVRGNDTRFTTFISDFAISHAQARREQMQLVEPESGAAFPVEVVSGKIQNERGETIAIVSVLHDLTKQVENQRLYEALKELNGQLEERVRAATAGLAEQNAQLQWQSRELERANRLKSEFLASMSHELRTPINALIGYTALMLDRIYGELTEKQEEGLRRIQASAQHLLALINDILDLAKIEAGKMPLYLEDLTLRSVIGDIVQQIEPLVRKKGLEFVLELPDKPVTMHTDRTKVKQILLNLLSNAVKFTHAGEVRLVVTRHGDMVRLEVVDTGIGIRPQDLSAIWEDFRQLDQSRTREYGGTGLGLSITRKLVARLGGDVGATSEYGKGSTFWVTLPLRTVPQPEDGATHAMTAPAGASS